MAMTNPQNKAMRRSRVKANKRVLLLVLAVTVVMINFLIDMAYLALDPRIAYEK